VPLQGRSLLFFVLLIIEKKEIEYQCSIHGKGKQIVKKFKSQPKNFKGDWRNWQYPKQNELCPKCRQNEVKKRTKEESIKFQQIWFNSLNEEQKQDLRDHQKRLNAEKKYEQKIRCQNGFVSQVAIIDYKKKIAGDN